MSDERRYDEATIAEIFRQAAEAQNSAQQGVGAGGLTLEELQEIGREAGLSPEFVARAAERLGTEVVVESPPTQFGMPIGVSRAVDLPGTMTDDEWDQLVVELRQTFKAKGKLHRSGKLRDWSNGNLHFGVEPGPNGDRLRMRSMRGVARELLTGGASMLALTLIAAVGMLLAGKMSGGGFGGLSMVAMMGAAMAGFAVLQLKPWIEERGRQMDDIGRRMVERMQDRMEKTGQLEQSPAVMETIATTGEASLLEVSAEAEDQSAESAPVSRGQRLR